MTLPPDQESPGRAPRRTANIRYVTEPQHVREVSLIGTSDFGFWSDYLKAEGLEPVRCGNAAQVVVVAAEMVYLGVPFAEVSFSVRASLVQDSDSTGLRLLHAFTSSRVFAWCERTLFATPYVHGECHVSVRSPPSFRVKAQGVPIVSGEMSVQERPAIRAGDECWEAPVFLPPSSAAGDQRLFFGRLSGHTVVYSFSGDDRFAVEPIAGGRVLQPLADSRFYPQEWVVRADATHGKSKTYRRSDVLTMTPSPFKMMGFLTGYRIESGRECSWRSGVPDEKERQENDSPEPDKQLIAAPLVSHQSQPLT